LEILEASLIKSVPPKTKPGKSDPGPTTKTYTTKLPAKKLKVSAYKQWLQQELQKLAGAKDDDEMELNDN
jgi:hypothetical protein